MTHHELQLLHCLMNEVGPKVSQDEVATMFTGASSLSISIALNQLRRAVAEQRKGEKDKAENIAKQVAEPIPRSCGYNCGKSIIIRRLGEKHGQTHADRKPHKYRKQSNTNQTGHRPY